RGYNENESKKVCCRTGRKILLRICCNLRSRSAQSAQWFRTNNARCFAPFRFTLARHQTPTSCTLSGKTFCTVLSQQWFAFIVHCRLISLALLIVFSTTP